MLEKVGLGKNACLWNVISVVYFSGNEANLLGYCSWLLFPPHNHRHCELQLREASSFVFFSVLLLSWFSMFSSHRLVFDVLTTVHAGICK